MSASKSANKSIKFQRKNDGQEVAIDFTYLCKKELTYPQQVAVEMWVKEMGVSMLLAFKMKFPELVER